MRVEYKNRKYDLPDFLIIGAAKSGTTSLFHYLCSHPDIFMPKIKESWFFTYKDDPPGFVTPDALKVVSDVDNYSRLFAKAKKGQILGEASLSCLYFPEKTISNIKKIYGDKFKDLKIIAVLREPAERAWSNYMHLRRDMQEPLDFREAVKKDIIKERLDRGYSILYDYPGLSLYYKSIKHYLDTFPLTKIFLFEELKENPGVLLKEVCDFLEVEGVIETQKTNRVHNSSGEFSQKLRILRPVYAWYSNPSNNFRQLAGKVLPNSLKSLIDSKIRSLFLKKKEMPSKLKRKIIRDYFFQDIKNLQGLLPGKRDRLQKWLN